MVPATDSSLLLRVSEHRRRSILPARPKSESRRPDIELDREEAQRDHRANPDPILSAKGLGATAEE